MQLAGFAAAPTVDPNEHPTLHGPARRGLNRIRSPSRRSTDRKCPRTPNTGVGDVQVTHFAQSSWRNARRTAGASEHGRLGLSRVTNGPNPHGNTSRRIGITCVGIGRFRAVSGYELTLVEEAQALWLLWSQRGCPASTRTGQHTSCPTSAWLCSASRRWQTVPRRLHTELAAPRPPSRLRPAIAELWSLPELDPTLQSW